MALIKDPNATIFNIKKKLKDLENYFANSGKYLGSFVSLIEAEESGATANAVKNDYIYVLLKDTKTLFIFDGEEWVEGFTVNIDYLDPSDFCIIISNSGGTLSSQEFAKFKNNLNAIKIYNEYTKAFYHSAYEDNTKYYFHHYEHESSLKQHLYVLSIDKETGAYQTVVKHVNIPDISEIEYNTYKKAIEENAENMRAVKQIIVANLGGNSGNFDQSQIAKLLNYEAKDDTGEGEQYKKLINSLFVKLWDNSSGSVYQLVSKPINNSFGNWIFTNIQVLGSTLNASLSAQKIIVNVLSESDASWTKVVKNIS